MRRFSFSEGLSVIPPKRRGSDHLDERSRNLLCERTVYLPVQGDHGPVCRGRVGVPGGHVRLEQCTPHGGAAGVVVLDDHGRWLGKLPDEPGSGMQVEVVVVGHLLSLEGLLAGNTGSAVHCPLLVGVLAVPKRPAVGELERQDIRELLAEAVEVVADRGVVRGGPRECSFCEGQPLVSGKPPLSRALATRGYCPGPETTATSR